MAVPPFDVVIQGEVGQLIDDRQAVIHHFHSEFSSKTVIKSTQKSEYIIIKLKDSAGANRLGNEHIYYYTCTLAHTSTL